MFSRIDHVGIAVPNMDEAVRFYTETFDMRVAHEETNVAQGVREVLLDVGDDGGAQVQLLAPLRADSAVGKFLDRSGPGVQQVAYAVDDVEAATARLREAGMRVLYPAAQSGTAGSRVNFVHPKDAGGVLIELVEHPRA